MRIDEINPTVGVKPEHQHLGIVHEAFHFSNWEAICRFSTVH
jgi:hypothetical protein